MRYHVFILVFLFVASLHRTGLAQQTTITGKIRDAETGEAIAGASVYLKAQGKGATSDARGNYQIVCASGTTDSLTASLLGYEPATKIITASDARLEISFALRPRAVQAGEVIIKGRKSNLFGIGKLESIEGTAIYEAKKSEVITVDDLAANLAANNARQVFSKVAGLNVWESDCAGLQLSIGARGLSPSRSSNFNVRQNGYDISADALGYPE
ncbi:MAG: carboxypeptidase-like regulatory domain-containing protein, partial [Rhizobacter sp.]|nr:carboxypeptidase-like regulatory domain-containing protein [Chlorobiales bacterium]